MTAPLRQQSVLYKGDPDDDDARFDWVARHQRKYTAQELMLPDWDPVFNILEEYRYDPETRSMTIKRTQYVQPMLEDNAAHRAANYEGWRKDDAKWVKMASIPNLVVEMWLKEGIDVYAAEMDRHGVPNDHMKAVLKKLRDPDWKWLKCHDMDFGDGKTTGRTRAVNVPHNGFPWLVRDSI